MIKTKTFTGEQCAKAAAMLKSGLPWLAIGEMLNADAAALRKYCEAAVGRPLPDKQEKAATSNGGKVVGRWTVDRLPMPEKLKRRCRELEALAGTLGIGDHVAGMTQHEVYSLREHLAKRSLYASGRIEIGSATGPDARWGVWVVDIKDAPKRSRSRK